MRTEKADCERAVLRAVLAAADPDDPFDPECGESPGGEQLVTSPAGGGQDVSRPQEPGVAESFLEDDHSLQVEGEVENPVAPPSDTSLEVDLWGRIRGSDLQREHKDLCDDKLAWADFRQFLIDHYVDFAGNPVGPAKRRRQFLETILTMDGIRELRRETAGRESVTEMVVSHVGKMYGEVISESPDDSDAAEETRILRVAKKAVQEAAELASAARGAEDMFGVGCGGAANGDSQLSRALFDKIRNNQYFRRLIQLAGRYRRLAANRQATKPFVGRTEFCGVEMGSDIGRTLPTELVMLAIPEMEVEFMRRFVESSLQVYEVTAREPEALGPVVVCLDESGSMHGDRDCHAKAICLAICWVARQQKRPVWLFSFAEGPGTRMASFSDGEFDPARVLDWMSSFQNGGTTLDVPLEVVPRQWEKLGCPVGKTDMIIITDACVDADEKMKSNFRAWKEASSCRVDSIIIGEDAGVLAEVSDRAHLVRHLGVEVEAVSEVLSI